MAVAEQPTIEEVARQLGVTRQTLHQWQREGCPTHSAEAAREWRNLNKRPRYGGPQANVQRVDGDVQQAILLGQAVKIREEGRAKKLKNDILEGKLVYRDDAQQTMNAICALVRTRVEAWPDRLYMEWPAEIRDSITVRLRDEVRLLLTEIAHADIG